MSNTSSSSQNTFPLFGILGIAFVVLKLTDHIDWSWWWVLAPFWGPFAALIAVAVMGGLIALPFILGAKNRALKKRTNNPYVDPFRDPFFTR